MKMKAYGLLVMALLVLSVMPLVAATDVGAGVGVSITTEQFAPRVWMCGDRVLTDDNYEQGANGLSLLERKNNYAFEGEQISWKVLVMDKNKIEQITDVVGTIGSSQGVGNDIEVECKEDLTMTSILPSCNAKIDQFSLTNFDNKVMRYYDCTLTVETPVSMHGEYFITVEAMDSTGESAVMDENEYWFLNPEIALAVDGDLTFDDVMPGTSAYSQTLLVGNDAEDGSGVVLDMFISGDDFYDPASSGAACPDTNQLALSNFRYFATNGAYSTLTSPVADVEGYVLIPNSKEISAAKKIIRFNDAVRGAAVTSSVADTDWNKGNALTPGAEMALTFRLEMPEPCVGDFSEGQIYFWGEAI